MSAESLIRKFIFILCFSAAGCVPDRDIAIPPPPPGDGVPPAPGDLLINEFVAKGSVNANEFGTFEDWLEIYNTTGHYIQCDSGLLSLTDDPGGSPDKFTFPAVTLPPHGFLLVWCDGLDTVANEIHSNFKLSSTGEDLGLFYLNDTTNALMDQYTYGMQTEDGISNGRSPDGSPNWVRFNIPTPGDHNP